MSEGNELDGAAARAHRPMSGFDVLMYRGEAKPRTRTAMVGLYLFDRAPAWDGFLAHMDQASRRFPGLRERVVEATNPLVDARWVTDPDFDLAYQVRRLQAPAPGTFHARATASSARSRKAPSGSPWPPGSPSSRSSCATPRSSATGTHA